MRLAKHIELLVLLTLFFVTHASAGSKEEICTDGIHTIVGREVKAIDFAPKEQGGNVISESCRSWPLNENIELTAFAYDEGVEAEKKLIVAMIDKKTKHIVSDYRIKIEEDAITEVGEYSLQIDTARYQLTKSLRAFGLRFNSAARGPSCGNGHWNTELILLVRDGKKLRPVLNLYLYQQESVQGCLSVQDPSAIWKDAELTVGIAKTSTNGFRDLLVKAKITTHSNGAQIGNMKDRVEHHILRYNGKYYDKGKNIPWWLDIHWGLSTVFRIFTNVNRAHRLGIKYFSF